MAEVKIELTNAETLRRDVEKITRMIQDGSLLGLIGRVALAIERQAKINASGRPGPMVRTGRLRSSITTKIDSYEKAVVGTNVEYAPYVEFGHKQTPGRFIPIQGFRKLNASVYVGGRRRTAYEAIGGFRLVKPFAPAYPFLGPTLQQVDLQGVVATFARDIEMEWQ